MRWLLLCLFLAAHGALAGVIVGKVVGIPDVDTLTILDAGKRQHRIRLADIDALKKGQPFGDASKRSQSNRCFGRQAEVDDRGQDRYGRTIGQVTCAGVDANAEQVRRGMAWVFERYSASISPLYDHQREAQAIRRKVSADAEPERGMLWAWSNVGGS